MEGVVEMAEEAEGAPAAAAEAEAEAAEAEAEEILTAVPFFLLSVKLIS